MAALILLDLVPVRRNGVKSKWKEDRQEKSGVGRMMWFVFSIRVRRLCHRGELLSTHDQEMTLLYQHDRLNLLLSCMTSRSADDLKHYEEMVHDELNSACCTRDVALNQRAIRSYQEASTPDFLPESVRDVFVAGIGCKDDIPMH